VLQERYGRGISARTIAVLVDGALEILRHSVRAEMN